jgi:hypothetical protein
VLWSPIIVLATGRSIASGKAVTIEIHVTIQNSRYYSNSEYEQYTGTHPGVAQAPKSLRTI